MTTIWDYDVLSNIRQSYVKYQPVVEGASSLREFGVVGVGVGKAHQRQNNNNKKKKMTTVLVSLTASALALRLASAFLSSAAEDGARCDREVIDVSSAVHRLL